MYGKQIMSNVHETCAITGPSINSLMPRIEDERKCIVPKIISKMSLPDFCMNFVFRDHIFFLNAHIFLFNFFK